MKFALEAAADKTLARPDRIVLIAPMISGNRELIAGVVRDPQFGPTVMLGVGGILAEAVADVVFRPAPVDAITASVKKTSRCVVVEEGWEVCGVGAQVVDYVQRHCFDYLDAPVLRVHQADAPMPYTKSLEKAAKPDLPKTIAAIRQVLYLD